MIGLVNSASFDGERRIPIHPSDFTRIPPEIRKTMLVDDKFGAEFGVTEDDLRQMFGHVYPRPEVLRTCQRLILAKPTLSDIEQLAPDSIVWGWNHCVQNPPLVDLAVQKRLTMISFERMFHRPDDVATHVFRRNNIVAGFSGAWHAWSVLQGCTDWRPKTAVLIGFGAVGEGARFALQGLGLPHLTILTRRNPAQMPRLPRVTWHQIHHLENNRLSLDGTAAGIDRFCETLDKHDLVINAFLQDTRRPCLFLADREPSFVSKPRLLLDLSADDRMGFTFSRPTSMSAPMRKIADAYYYAVPNTPTRFWRTLSRILSRQICAFLPEFASPAMPLSEIFMRATDIQNGTIRHEEIIAFQRRESAFPHQRLLSS